LGFAAEALNGRAGQLAAEAVLDNSLRTWNQFSERYFHNR
jgi:hypothetical protein